MGDFSPGLDYGGAHNSSQPLVAKFETQVNKEENAKSKTQLGTACIQAPFLVSMEPGSLHKVSTMSTTSGRSPECLSILTGDGGEGFKGIGVPGARDLEAEAHISL